jgi:DNA-binding beta-propeller fold protein YncE
MQRRCLLGWAVAASVTLPWQPARAAARLEVRVLTMISVGKEPQGAALRADESDLYVTLPGGAAGVGKMDLSTRQVSPMSPAPIATDLALTPDGNFLYVNYQHYGPGGREGHDETGKFDARTGKFRSAIKGLPNVGNTLAVSPDGRRLWANGDDACISHRYDHLGCPAVPAGIMKIIDTATDRLVRSLPLVAGVPFGITFPRDGRRPYATLPEQNAVAVLDISRR